MWYGHAERTQNKEYQKQLQQLQWKEEVTVDGHVTEEEKRMKNIKYRVIEKDGWDLKPL